MVAWKVLQLIVLLVLFLSSLLSGILRHQYPKDFERTWRQARESINQHMRDLRSKHRHHGAATARSDSESEKSDNDFD